MAETMRIDAIQIGPRARKDMGDIASLARSIADVGLLHPVVVTPAGLLIAGQRRLEACRQLGLVDVPVTVVNLEDVKRGEHDENVQRKDWLPSEAVAIKQTLEQVPLGRPPTGTEPAGKRREKVVKLTRFSAGTLSKAEAVVNSGDEALIAQMDMTGNVDRAYRELRNRNAPNPPPLPEDQFNLVYADPPWQFVNSGFQQSANAAYPTMDTEKIAGMVLPKIASEAVLFLWATNAMLPDALLVMETWGFEYKTNIVWCKDRTPGMGWFTNSKHELLLIGTRGSMHPEVKPDSWQHLPQGEHSAKPHKFYDIIESMYPNTVKIELFARNKRTDWKSWGNEIK